MVKNKHMSDFICELHNLSLQRFVIDDNHCLQLVNCHECNSQLRQIWTRTAKSHDSGGVPIRFPQQNKDPRVGVQRGVKFRWR